MRKRKQKIYDKAHELASKNSIEYSDTGDTFGMYTTGDPLKEARLDENLVEAGKFNISLKKKQITKLFQLLEQKERELEAKKRAEDEIVQLAKEKADTELKALEEAEEDEEEEIDLTTDTGKTPKIPKNPKDPKVDEEKKEDKVPYIPPTVQNEIYKENDDWELGAGTIAAGGIATAALLAYLYPGTRKYMNKGFKLAGKGLWAPVKYTGRGAKSIYNRIRGVKNVAKDLKTESGAVTHLPINKRGPLALPPRSAPPYAQRATFSPVNPIPGRQFSYPQLTTGSPLGLPSNSGLPIFNSPRFKSGGKLIQRNK